MELEKFFESVAEPREHIRTSKGVVVNKIGRQLYEKFFRNYTRKQWDLDPSELDSSVIAHVAYPHQPGQPVLYGYGIRLCLCMARSPNVRNMLDHPNIKILLNCDYREIEDTLPFREMISPARSRISPIPVRKATLPVIGL